MKRKAIDDSRALPFGGVAKKKNPFFVNDSCAAGCSHSNRCYETNLGGKGSVLKGRAETALLWGFGAVPSSPGSLWAANVLFPCCFDDPYRDKQ